ncbi:MAG: hypothetical protein R3A44_10115 [Caldilineaceae bacterium]
MNRNIFTIGRRQFAIWSVAAALAFIVTFGQGAMGQVFGVEMAPTASACQSQGSSGC